MKAGYFETSGSDYSVTQPKYRHLIRVELVLNGICNERKPDVGVEFLQCRVSSPRNVIKPPFISRNCVTRRAILYYTEKILEVFIFTNLAHYWKQIRVRVMLFIIKKTHAFTQDEGTYAVQNRQFNCLRSGKKPAFGEKQGSLPYRYRQVSLYNIFVHIVAIFLTAEMQTTCNP